MIKRLQTLTFSAAIALSSIAMAGGLGERDYGYNMPAMAAVLKKPLRFMLGFSMEW